MTEEVSPQRPHCLTTFVGSFRIGLLVAATACSAWALSSALLSAGPRRRCFIGRASAWMWFLQGLARLSAFCSWKVSYISSGDDDLRSGADRQKELCDTLEPWS